MCGVLGVSYLYSFRPHRALPTWRTTFIVIRPDTRSAMSVACTRIYSKDAMDSPSIFVYSSDAGKLGPYPYCRRYNIYTFSKKNKEQHFP